MYEAQIVMLTIKEAKNHYPGTSENAIRQWVKNGELPAVRCGNKILICNDVMDSFLRQGNNQPTPTKPEYGKIRRLG